MEFSVKRQRNRKQLRLGRNPDDYPHAIQFYKIPPTDNIALQEFEEFAIERLKVLKIIENAGIKFIKDSDGYKQVVMDELKKQGIRGYIPKVGNPELTDLEYNNRRKDNISHFILRLAYCRSEELRRWFLQQELDLFRMKFTSEPKDSIQQFLKINNLNYKPIPKEEKHKHTLDLQACSKERSSKVDSEDYYKVPWIEVLDLVRTRKVFLERGMAFVPQSEMVVIVLHHYRKHLSHALAITSRALPHLEEDGRLLPMLSSLSKRYLGSDYANKKPTSGSDVKAEMVDNLAKQNFPPCMQYLHQGLKQNHHLRHGGRLQYGLFLKAVGLTLEEAMRFWRQEFLKSMDPDKFDKQYAYGVRYNYGKEGGRKNYTPHSCIKIITASVPGPGDFHGCPFKHSDATMLKQRLQSAMMSKSSIDQVLQYTKGGHYQLACGEYFKFFHGDHGSFVPNHPNQYYDETLVSFSENDKSSQSQTSNVLKAKNEPLTQQVSQSKLKGSSQGSSNNSDSIENEEQMDA